MINTNQDIPFCRLQGYDQKMLLLDVMKNGFYLKSRQIPDNIDAMASTLKADIVKYMPKVTERQIRDGVEYYILHDSNTALSVAEFYKAIRSKYVPPYEQRDCDRDQYTRPDTENDTITLLDMIADRIKEGKQAWCQWKREYAYLVMRKQIAWDAFEHEIENAKTQINMERMKELERPLVDFEGSDKFSLVSRAKQLVVRRWLSACNDRGVRPSAILAPLVDEMQYSTFRIETK